MDTAPVTTELQEPTIFNNESEETLEGEPDETQHSTRLSGGRKSEQPTEERNELTKRCGNTFALERGEPVQTSRPKKRRMTAEDDAAVPTNKRVGARKHLNNCSAHRKCITHTDEPGHDAMLPHDPTGAGTNTSPNSTAGDGASVEEGVRSGYALSIARTTSAREQHEQHASSTSIESSERIASTNAERTDKNTEHEQRRRSPTPRTPSAPTRRRKSEHAARARTPRALSMLMANQLRCDVRALINERDCCSVLVDV